MLSPIISSEGRDDTKSLHTIHQSKRSLEEAQTYTSELMQAKLQQSCQPAVEDWDNNSQNGGSDTTKAGSGPSSEADDQCRGGSLPETNGQRIISIAHPLWKFKEQIGQKASELNVCYQLGVNNIMVSGEDSGIQRFQEYIEGLSKIRRRPTIDGTITEEQREAQQRDHEMGPFVQRTLRIHSAVKAHIDEVQQTATELNLTCDALEDKISIAGPQKFVLEFISWIYDFTLTCDDLEATGRKDLQIADYCESEIGISTFHRMHKQDITKKAAQLQLELQFAYDLVIVSGSVGNVKEFKSYVHEVEAAAKRSLYPKFWDFRDVNPYSEIEIKADSQEFSIVSTLFYNTMKEFQITKVIRVQNKYLMDHYATMIQKRQEVRPQNEPNRKLLFHATRKLSPDVIYKNYDTGFDLQFANFGDYGRGIYFAIDASYSHEGFRHEIGPNKWRMMIADVFTGKSYRSYRDGSLIKAPEGYDSVEAVENQYVLYNNFHSYPLYLIDYEAKVVS